MRFLNTLKTPVPIKRKTILALRDRFIKISKKHNLELLVIHGSLARDSITCLSDIDIAFLKKQRASFKTRCDLLADLQDLIGREDIDLVDLYGANPLMRMSVLKNGLFVYVKSQRAAIHFRYKTARDYLATQWLRERFSYYLRKAVLGGK